MLTGSLVANYPILPKKVMDPIQLSLSLGEIAVRSHRLMVDFLIRRPELGGLGDPAGIGQAFLQLTAKMIADPMSIAQMQLELWTDHMKLWQRTTERLFDLTGKSDQRPAATDRRFQHPAWTENVLFDYIKQSYVISAEAILSAVNRVNGLNPKTAHKVDFYTRQFVDAMSPSNFLATNPEVLQTTIETGGENLLRGLTNLLDDLERGRGQLAVTMTDLKAFRLGENVAAQVAWASFVDPVLRVVEPVRIGHRIEVVQVTEELVEAVHREEILVQVAQMVLAKLPGFVTLCLEHGGQGHGLVGQAYIGTRLAYRG
jgi:polyhydroxyalkanoate synthase